MKMIHWLTLEEHEDSCRSDDGGAQMERQDNAVVLLLRSDLIAAPKLLEFVEHLRDLCDGDEKVLARVRGDFCNALLVSARGDEVPAQATPFQEACMRAWVDGWYAGRNGVLNDDGKRACADKLAKQFPAENAAQELLAASKRALQLCRDAAQIEDEDGQEVLPDYVETVLENAIAKAEGEKP